MNVRNGCCSKPVSKGTAPLGLKEGSIPAVISVLLTAMAIPMAASRNMSTRSSLRQRRIFFVRSITPLSGWYKCKRCKDSRGALVYQAGIWHDNPAIFIDAKRPERIASRPFKYRMPELLKLKCYAGRKPSRHLFFYGGPSAKIFFVGYVIQFQGKTVSLYLVENGSV